MSYHQYYEAYVKRYIYKTKKCCQEEVTKLWNTAKQRFPKKDDLVLHVQYEIDRLLREALEKKARTTLAFLVKGNTKTSNGASSQAGTSAQSLENMECAGAPKRKIQPLETSVDENESTSNSTPSAVHPTPAQDRMKEKIAKLRVELDLTERRKGSLIADGTEHEKARKLRREIDDCEKKLRLKERQRMYATKHRENKKQKIMELCSKNLDVAKSLAPRAGPGRPRLEEEQPELLKTIVDLAMFGASAEERRRCEIVRTVQTLSELTIKLTELGINISRSATYIRLLPKRVDTREGKRHVVTVPVKPSRPEADHHKAHQDQYFCVAPIRSLETVASVLGPHSVIFFLSQDDKARVPMRLTAANKQAPMLMHVEYKVSLPDHDFVIASSHKLIPSVYGFCGVKSNEMGRPEAVSHSGPTYIAIRSGKHSSSTATSHAQDLDALLTLEPFHNFMKDEKGKVKPVLIISSDGGPDENPRYHKVIAHAIERFKKYDLDAIFITNAPGRSAFNRVEWRMAPLSRELTGVVLPHDSFGTHLDSSRRTVDVSLEKDNFKKAGEILGEIWSAVCIDGYEVVAKYIDPNNDTSSVPDLPFEGWYAEHVRESQYLLQVVKCDDQDCCTPRRSDLHTILHDRFLPPPYPITQVDGHLTVPSPEEHDGKSFAPFLIRHCLPMQPSHAFIRMPYDLYCPSVRRDLEKRCCSTCGIYCSSITRAAEHQRAVHSAPVATARKVRPSRIVTRRATELLCASDDGLEWLNQRVVEGADDFTENQMDKLVPLVTLQTIHESPWAEMD